MTTLNWTHVQSWIQSNPNKSASLKPYIPAKQSVEGEAQTTDEYGWTKIPVSPATPLSAVLLTQDVMYLSQSEGARGPILRNETTDCQEKAVLHLKGRAWPVRRTAEGIAAVGMNDQKVSDWTDIGWRAIAALREVQIIIVNEQAKSIQFVPEDIRAWSNEVDTICVAHDARFVWSHPSSAQILHKWIADYVTNGWSVEWPLADGTMEELKTAAAKHGIAGKHVKDELRKKIGHSQSLQHILGWSNKIDTPK
jgi:hypothetical protein